MTDTPAEVEGEDTDALLDEVIAEACAEDSAEAEQYRERLQKELRGKSDMFESMVEHEEELRLGDAGWKARYYEQKFGISAGPEQDELIAQLSKSFVEGLCWVMRYYFEGVASWRWFYPFHYAPFASDLVRLEEMQVRPHCSLGLLCSRSLPRWFLQPEVRMLESQ
jgi:5'-3' exoribonuclease 2